LIIPEDPSILVEKAKENLKKILSIIGKAKDKKAEIVVFPELAICGYPPDDLVLFSSFIEEIEKGLLVFLVDIG